MSISKTDQRETSADIQKKLDALEKQMESASVDEKKAGREQWEIMWEQKRSVERIETLESFYQIDNEEFVDRAMETFPLQYETAIKIEIPKDLTWAGSWSLTIQGANGRGKSWLAIRLLVQWMIDKLTQDVMWVNCAVVADDLRSELKSDQPTSLISQMREARLLVLDDFGAIRDTPFLSESMRIVICDRYDYMRKTIVTCDVPLSQFEDRIESRLRQGTIYGLSGGDRRVGNRS